MTFDQLNLNSPLLNALNDMELKTPTLIQERAFPVVMSGENVVGIAQTGTGKTLAYLLPMLRQWKFAKVKHPQFLVIVPTRELVVQVVEEAKKLTEYMNVDIVGVYGGTNIKTQMAAVNKGVDLIVGTPGRLLDIALTGVLRFKNLKKLVIDEVDEMLNLGFRPQLIRVMDLIPEKRQNLMFSATMTKDVEEFIKEHFGYTKRIEAASTGTPLENIQQTAYRVPNFNTKINLLELLLAAEDEMTKVLVFTATKKLADQLYEKVAELHGEEVGIIHSNKSQNNRLNTVKSFHNGEFRILIATDLVARGLDISEVSHVINFDIPDVPENYMHRIGRTGRVDKRGIAITLITEKEVEYQEGIESLMGQAIPIADLPEDLEISDVLTYSEMPQVSAKEIERRIPTKEQLTGAFHEKKEKNLKERKHVRRSEAMKQKYKKPKTRGQKRKKR